MTTPVEERRPAPATTPRPDASMTLLIQVMENPLDPGYEAMTKRRRENPDWRPSRTSRLLIFLVAIAIGAGLAISISSPRSPASGRNAARALLVEQVTERQQVQDDLVAQNAELSAQILELSSAELVLTDPARRTELEQLAVVSGIAPVHGPGIVVTLNDSERAQDDPVAFGAETVQAGDLQIVVNAMWAGGAEAIAVNGTRLGANGGIRGAGQAILVDRVTISPPYEVVAIGPRDELTKAVASGTAGQHLDLLRVRYGIGVNVTGDADLRLPGSLTTQLRYAEAVETSDGHTGDQNESNESNERGDIP